MASPQHVKTDAAVREAEEGAQLPSHRQILRASSIIGGASVANIVIGLARSKVMALLLGPSGLGLVALLLNVVSTGAVVAALGINQPAVRDLAEANGRDDAVAVARIRAAIFRLTALLAVVGGGAFWLLRGPIARTVLNDAGLAPTLGWLALAVALTVISGSQMALLNGYRRIGDIARLQVLSALLSTVAGVAVLAVYGERGVIAYIVAAPAAAVVIGLWATARLPRPAPISAQTLRTAPASHAIGWSMVRLGASFMLAGLVQMAGLLVIRVIVLRHLGPPALGDFSAAWMISMTYVGFVLQAMGTDYLPRLAAVVDAPATVNRMVNEQTEIALILAAPVLIGVQAAAPWLIHLLYSSEFSGTTAILRWQILGDVLKIVSWPLGFILIATRRGKTFLAAEAASMAVFVGVVWALVDAFGVAATGFGFVVTYVCYIPIVFGLAVRITGFRWNRRSVATAAAVFGAVGAVMAGALLTDLAALLLGVVLGGASAAYAVLRLRALDALPGGVAKALDAVSPTDRKSAPMLRKVKP